MRPGRAVLIPGTFDPPTDAHIKIGDIMHAKFPGSKIIYVPCNDHYIDKFKETKNYIDMDDRVRLLYQSINMKYASVSIYEGYTTSEKKYGYFIDTIEHFKGLYDNVITCLGEDTLETIDQWYKAEKLFTENKFIVIRRSGKSYQYCGLAYSQCGHNIEIMFDAIPDISSSKIRKWYLEGNWDDIFQNVPESVFMYLRYTRDDLFQ